MNTVTLPICSKFSLSATGLKGKIPTSQSKMRTLKWVESTPGNWTVQTHLWYFSVWQHPNHNFHLDCFYERDTTTRRYSMPGFYCLSDAKEYARLLMYNLIKPPSIAKK